MAKPYTSSYTLSPPLFVSKLLQHDKRTQNAKTVNRKKKKNIQRAKIPPPLLYRSKLLKLTQKQQINLTRILAARELEGPRPEITLSATSAAECSA